MKIKEKDSLYHGQLPILEFINENPGCTQKDISNRFVLSKAAVSKSITRMEGHGYLRSETDPKDMRKIQLYITEKGICSIQQVRKVFDDTDVQMFENFSQEEIEQFCQYLDRILDNLETENTREKGSFDIMRQTEDIVKKNKQ